MAFKRYQAARSRVPMAIPGLTVTDDGLYLPSPMRDILGAEKVSVYYDVDTQTIALQPDVSGLSIKKSVTKVAAGFVQTENPPRGFWTYNEALEDDNLPGAFFFCYAPAAEVVLPKPRQRKPKEAKEAA